MPDVKLTLTAEVADYVNKMKQASRANQDNADSVKKSTDKQKQSVDSLIAEYDKLWAVQRKNIHSNVQETDAWQKKWTEVNQKLKDVKDATEGVTKSTEKVDQAQQTHGRTLKDTIKQYIGLTAIMAIVVEIGRQVIGVFKDTTTGMNFMTRAGLVWKKGLYDLATLSNRTKSSIQDVYKLADKMNVQREIERKDLVTNAKLQNEYNDLLVDAAKSTDPTRRIELFKKAEGVFKRMNESELTSLKAQRDIIKDQLVMMPELQTAKDALAKLDAQIALKEGEQNRKLEGQATQAIKQEHEDQIKRWHDEIEEQNNQYEEKLRIQKQFLALSEKLQDEHDKSGIKYLSGEKRLEAERDFALRQILELRNQMVKLGVLTDEQKEQFVGWWNNVWKEFYKQAEETAKDTKIPKVQRDAITKALFTAFEVTEQEGDEFVKKMVGGISELPNKIVDATQSNLTAQRAGAANKKFSMWSLLGLNPEDDEDQIMISAIEDTTGKIKAVIDDLYEKRVQDAQRNRELLDQQVSEAQSALETETQLYAAGYSSNVTLKKQELEAVKKQRDEALKEEAKAVQKQRTLQALSQTASLLTSAANMISSATSKSGWLGLVIAAGAIASMYAIWANAKVKVSSSTQLAKGGSGDETGIIKGKRHHQGGEQFTDNIEIEHGEAWGVLNRKATERYAPIFHEMISSFNRGELPIVTTPSVSVNMDTKGSNKRLDAVRSELQKVNKGLSREVIYSGNKKIIHRGNLTQIINR